MRNGLRQCLRLEKRGIVLLAILLVGIAGVGGFSPMHSSLNGYRSRIARAILEHPRLAGSSKRVALQLFLNEKHEGLERSALYGPLSSDSLNLEMLRIFGWVHLSHPTLMHWWFFTLVIFWLFRIPDEEFDSISRGEFRTGRIRAEFAILLFFVCFTSLALQNWRWGGLRPLFFVFYRLWPKTKKSPPLFLKFMLFVGFDFLLEGVLRAVLLFVYFQEGRNLGFLFLIPRVLAYQSESPLELTRFLMGRGHYLLAVGGAYLGLTAFRSRWGKVGGVCVGSCVLISCADILSCYHLKLLPAFVNLIFTPIFSVLVYPLWGLAALVTAVFPETGRDGAALLFSIGGGIFSGLLDCTLGLVKILQSVGIGVVIHFGRDSAIIFLFLALLCAVIFSLRKIPVVAFGLGIGVACLCLGFRYRQIPLHQIVQVDVGQGDAALLIRPEKVTLVDFGGDKLGFSAGLSEEEWLTKLSAYQVSKIDLALLTHHDSDHQGGWKRLQRLIKIQELVDFESLPCSASPFSKTADYRCGETADGNERVWSWNEGRLVIRQAPMHHQRSLLRRSPFRLSAVPAFKPNEAMLWVFYRDTFPTSPDAAEKFRTIVYLNLGDSGKLAEEAGLSWIQKNLILSSGSAAEPAGEAFVGHAMDHAIRILKLSHHGSKTSTSENLLRAFAPTEVWISAGRKNRFGHPHEEVMRTVSRYVSKCEKFVPIKMTAVEGDIVFK